MNEFLVNLQKQTQALLELQKQADEQAKKAFAELEEGAEKEKLRKMYADAKAGKITAIDILKTIQGA